MQPRSQRISFKVVLLGDSGVGKTAITQRQCCNTFNIKILPTAGVCHLKTIIHVGQVDVELLLWDTAGQERYAPLVSTYLRQASAGIIVASALDSISIENIRNWRAKLLEIEPNAFCVLAINKMDLVTDQGIRQQIQIGYQEEFDHIYLISAKTGDGVNEVFNLIAESLFQEQKSSETIILPAEIKNSKKCC